jgi:two-component system LytT family response regulator
MDKYMNMKAIIVEDEQANREELSFLLATHCPSIELVGEAINAEQGAELILHARPDLVFLDIIMPHKTGFDMLKMLDGYDFSLVFVTGHHQFGIEAVKASALDYLLKPVQATELVQAVWKASRVQTRKDVTGQVANLLHVLHSNERTDHRIVLPLMKELRFELPSNIMRCEAANSYTWCHMANGEKLMLSRTLGEFEKLLAPYGFMKCHHSHLVNRVFVKRMVVEDRVYELVMANKERIPVSRLKKDLIKDMLTK